MPERGKRQGQRLDNYQLLHLLGRGSFGEVYKAEDVHRRTIVAVKVLPQLAESDIASFLNEARTIRLKHPHIVQVLDFGIEEHIPFIVMDYAPHGTLRQRHAQGSRVPLDVIVGYVEHIAGALQYAHNERVIHRDIKPGNLLLGEHDEVLVSDFGISMMAHSSHSQIMQKMAGTMAYMAPEQIQGKPRFASDQYALGVIVYEWLCGERPFSGTHLEVAAQHIAGTPSPLHEKMPVFAAEVEQVVMVALAKDPKERFGSIKAFATALEQAASGQRRKYYTVPIAPSVESLPSPTSPSLQPAQSDVFPVVKEQSVAAPKPLPDPTPPFLQSAQADVLPIVKEQSVAASSPRMSPPPVVPATPPLTVQPSGLVEGANSSLSTPPAMSPFTTQPSWSVEGANPSLLVAGPRGPLISPQNIAAPPATLQSQLKRDRLFYPLLALLMIFLIVALGGGGYYFLWQQQAENDVENTLRVANDTIQSAKAATANADPSDALKKLAGVQQNLKRIANFHLNTTQQGQLKQLLNDDLTMAVNRAMTQYNQQFAILPLPCGSPNSEVTQLTNGTVNTKLGSVVAVRNGQKPLFYALGEDRHLYQVDREQHTLGKEIPLDKQALAMTTTSLAADDTRLLLLTGDNGNNATLQLLIPNANGDVSKIVTQALSEWTKDGHKPTFLTASGPDIYVVLTREGDSTAFILDFMLDRDAFKPGPRTATISTSHTIVSAAALSRNQLFLLLNDGSVQSLQFAGDQQSLVFVNGPIAAPLQTNSADFSSNQTVPTAPLPIAASTTATGPVLLSIPTAIFLAAGTVGKVEHLYVVDGTYHRVIDLVQDSTTTTQTTTPTPEPTNESAGGGTAKQVTMKLHQQYASASLLATVKSISADPTKSGFYLLAQSDQGKTLNLIPADSTQQGVC